MIKFKKAKKSCNNVRNGHHNVYGIFANYRVAGIYFIECKVTNKRYIGSSKDIGIRLSKHFSELYLNTHTNKQLLNDFNKYGRDNFNFGILERTTDNLLELERKYQIEQGIDNLYNYKVSDYYIDKSLRSKYANSDKSSHKTIEYRNKMKLIKSNSIGQYIKCPNGNIELIRSYNNMDEVIEVNSTFKPQPIRGACNGSKRSAYGYHWRYLSK